jgi:hypothetical protein
MSPRGNSQFHRIRCHRGRFLHLSHSSIPYCIWNSIEGAFTITVTRTGNYGILSGEHRQMPNHEVIIMSTTSNATSATYTEAVVYRRDLSSPLCLVSMVCEKASMAGYTGTY